MNINRIFIIGDSFCHFLPTSKSFYQNSKNATIKWNQWLTWEYPNIEIVNDSYVSRDLQTIIDNWIKIIPQLNTKDFLILGIPSYFRQRVPLSMKDWQKNSWSKGKITNRFVTHHSWYTTESEKIYVGNSEITKDELNYYIGFFETLMASNSVAYNYIELIDSLYNITPCKKYLFSWDDLDPSSKYIDTKSILTKKLGMWTTESDLYNQSNGEYGIKDDFHWDYRTERRFFEFIKNKIEE